MLLADIVNDDTLWVEIGYLIFIWEGGAYIDILIRNQETMNVEYSAFCVNVWDYKKDETTIPFTLESLIDAATEWCNIQMRGI